MSALAVAALGLVCLLLGAGWASWLTTGRDSRPFRGVLALLTGLLALHLMLTALDLIIGLGWSWPALIGGCAVLVGVSWSTRSRSVPPPSPAVRLGWGDAIASVPLVAFAVLSWQCKIATPDFVYHWGIKAHRFFLHQGVDYEYLGRPWNFYAHPDYPNLAPELYAVTAAVGGGFEESAILLWSPLFFLLILVAARESLGLVGTSGFALQGTVALVALICGMVGIGHVLAGSPDWVISLTLLAAMPALVDVPERGRDLQIGVLAALAAAAKTEGIALGGILILVYSVRRFLKERRLGIPVLLRTALPMVVTVSVWVVQSNRHGLFQETNLGAFVPSRAPTIFRAVAQTPWSEGWNGVPLVLLLLPLLLVWRSLRPLAAVCFLQLAFYLFVYFAAPVDTRFYVLSSFPRLLFHLVPVLIVALAMTLEARPSASRVRDNLALP